MAEINTYGLPMNGLEEASKDIKEIKSLGKDHYYQVFYDKDNGDVWVVHHFDHTRNTFTHYRDSEVVEINHFEKYPSPQHIADTIKKLLDEDAYFESFLKN